MGVLMRFEAEGPFQSIRVPNLCKGHNPSIRKGRKGFCAAVFPRAQQYSIFLARALRGPSLEHEIGLRSVELFRSSRGLGPALLFEGQGS